MQRFRRQNKQNVLDLDFVLDGLVCEGSRVLPLSYTLYCFFLMVKGCDERNFSNGFLNMNRCNEAMKVMLYNNKQYACREL